MDVDTVEPGVDFVRVIEEAVGECDVLLALIGKRWANVGGGATSRLDDPEDFVRLEISTALARDIRVIPLLVDGMTMPSVETLPISLRPLSRRNAIEISNTRFTFDVERVITTVRKILDETEARGKAGDENRRHIGEQKNREPQEEERRRLEAEARWREEERGRKTDEADRRRIEQKVPRPWRTYGPLAAVVTVVLILSSSVFWWPKPQEAAKPNETPRPSSPGDVILGTWQQFLFDPANSKWEYLGTFVVARMDSAYTMSAREQREDPRLLNSIGIFDVRSDGTSWSFNSNWGRGMVGNFQLQKVSSTSFEGTISVDNRVVGRTKWVRIQ